MLKIGRCHLISLNLQQKINSVSIFPLLGFMYCENTDLLPGKCDIVSAALQQTNLAFPMQSKSKLVKKLTGSNLKFGHLVIAVKQGTLNLTGIRKAHTWRRHLQQLYVILESAECSLELSSPQVLS